MIIILNISKSMLFLLINLNESGLISRPFINDRPDNIDVFIKAQRKN